MHVDGACHCGRIEYTAEVDPATAGMCNCTDCQTLSGSPFRWVVPTLPGTFALRSGEVKVYVKTAESGNRRVQSFCPDCGTPIYSASVDPNPPSVTLRVGAIRQRGELVPKRQIWTRSAQGWLGQIPAISGRERQQ